MRRAIRLFSLILLCAAAAGAQTNTGGISGTVTDQTGAVVPDATVIVTNTGTNEVHRATTSKVGSYELQNLNPANYHVEIDATGFQKAVVSNVKVDTSSVATANFSLKPGNTVTQVEVTSRAPTLDTNNATLGVTISERMMNDLPLSNRSVLDLAATAPNVSGYVGTEDPQVTSGVPVPGFNLSLNGGRPGTSEMLADGVSNTGVGLAREVVAFSPETVQELSVQTSQYSAAFGRSGGGIINVTTKSGTNAFHGIETWYNRNPWADAAPYTTAATNRPSTNLKWNQMSFTLGGPVWIPKIYNGRDKTFFFVAVEPRYQEDTLQEDALLPTTAMRGGDFSNLDQVNGGWAPASTVAKFPQLASQAIPAQIYQQFVMTGNGQFVSAAPPSGIPSGDVYQGFGCTPGVSTSASACLGTNIIPQNMLDATSLKALKYMPLPQSYYINGNGDLVNYTLERFVHENERRYMVHIDENLTTRDRFSFRYSDVPEIGITGFGSPVNGNGATYSDSHQFMGSYTRTISPTIFNDLRLNYTFGNFSGTLGPQWDVNTGQNLNTQLGLPSLTKGGLPLIGFDTLDAFAAIGSTNSQLGLDTERQYEIADNLYISHGAMNWTMGFDGLLDKLYTVNLYGASGGSYSFRYVQTNSTGAGGTPGGDGASFASYLLGVPNAVTLADTIIPYNYGWKNYAAYVEDDWKARPNLTLNLGLRYSLQYPRAESQNFQGAFIPSLAQTTTLPQPVEVKLSSRGNPPLMINGQPYYVSSVAVPPFAFSGTGGNSKYLYPVNYADFEPRFGFAYQPHFFGMKNLVLRGGYGISHLPLTGQNRQPDPNFAAPSVPFNATSGQTNASYIMRLCCNPPNDPFVPPSQIVNIPSNGLEYQEGINIPGFVISPNHKTPQIQDWNLSFQRQFGANSMLEVAYVGEKGTYLYLPDINDNTYNPNFVQTLQLNGYNPVSTTVVDPLGRTGPPKCKPAAGGGAPVCVPGAALNIPVGTLNTPYVGFGTLETLYDAAGNSIRHAAYVSFTHRATKGLTLMANYTWGKSIDNSSTSSPDKNVLTSSNLPGGQITYGGTAAGDRAVSTFDIEHDFSVDGIYDLPFGRGRKFFTSMPKPLDAALGGWTAAGVERLFTGYPAVATESFGNYLGGTTHDIRPDLVPGVPLVNPLWTRTCPYGGTCQPYLNPAAFMETPAGELGNAPRTFASVRGPWQQYLDLSVQKNFQITERVRIQLRVDALNVLNHPLFQLPFNNDGGTQASDVFGGDVTNGNLTTAQYNTWATDNGQPLTKTSQGLAMYNGILSMVNAQRAAVPKGAPSGTLGLLPANFYTVPVPQGFALMNPNSFNIATLSGYKLYQVKNNYGNPGAFGQLTQNANIAPARYIQFGIRIFF
ncbi:MAG: carboxypeptidase regulatory-like domain-containing protein [Terriglobia bacterium]